MVYGFKNSELGFGLFSQHNYEQFKVDILMYVLG